MDTLERLRRIKQSHYYYNRMLTVTLAGAVCAVGFALWRADVPLLDEYKPGVGLAIMFLAFVFYKIPYAAYRLNRRRYMADDESRNLMGITWRQYRRRILQHPR